MAENFLKSLAIPRFKLPALVATVGHKLPQWPHVLVLIAAFNAVLKLKLLPDDSLELLEGRSFVVEVLDTGGCACFTYRSGLFRPLFTPPDTPDLAFRANLSAFLQLMTRQEDPDTLFFNRDLCIEGDTELGLIVKNMLDAVEWPALPNLLKLPGFRSAH
jgi:O2-independent ubiquinone biosynthesis accessory factor UbiT